jgi:heme/copper-type cytochrome/quinol oxidase subunit 2
MSNPDRDDSRGVRVSRIGPLGFVTMIVVTVVALAMGSLYIRRLYQRHLTEMEMEIRTAMVGYAGTPIGTGPGARVPLEVHAFTRKYEWHFQYPGPDGEAGATSPELVTKENPIGLDSSDPHAQDDVVTNELVLPCDETVRMLPHSADVIHTLGNLHGAFALDCTPGIHEGAILQTPAAPTSGALRCTTLCGAGHKDHHAPFRFVSSSDYEDWLKAKQTASRAVANPPAAPGSR